MSVIARRSSSVFKGTLQRACEIAAILNADYLLEGSVRRDGRRVRITVRLVEGKSKTDLWSETHDRTVDDWLSVQADVAAHVSRFAHGRNWHRRRALMPPIRMPIRRISRPVTTGIVPGDEGYEDALRYLDESIRRPRYAPALGLLARVRIGAAESPPRLPHGPARARDAARRALESDASNW